MGRVGSAGRLWLAAAVLGCGILSMGRLNHGEKVPAHAPLAEFPIVLGRWSGENVPLPERIVRAVGLDDYLNRIYSDGSEAPVTLYISYYGGQRTGHTIHSPKNCLPGTGWQPVESRRLAIPMAGTAPLLVNEYDVARDTAHVLVLYWYQERGRDVTSEYAAKFWLTADALTRDRTDGALVRVTTPIANSGREIGPAERRTTEFLRIVFPHLVKFIPN
ncbi:MAG: EpsI family protein [Acidobacteriota bacterium]|nr:EpsI family protein [Acidobacteriota bacterium]